MGDEREGGTVEIDVKGATADLIWRFLDFYIPDKVSPLIESCTILDGSSREPGCVRYCVTNPVPPPPGENASGEASVIRAKERLLAIDHAHKTYSYELIENNVGIQGYISQLKVFGEDGVVGCRVEWTFSADSYGVLSKEALGEFLKNFVQSVVHYVEQAAAKREP
ncbi:lachrymatory-factor synthase-like [Wolffia australiana]